MHRIKYSIIATLLFLTFAAGANAQTPKPTPTQDPVLVACEQTADALKRSQLDNQKLQIQLDGANAKLSVKDEEVANAREQRDFYKKAFEDLQKVDANNSKIDTNSQMVIDNLRIQLNDYKNENADLRRENDSLRKSREWRTIFGTGLGFAGGYYLGNKHN